MPQRIQVGRDWVRRNGRMVRRPGVIAAGSSLAATAYNNRALIRQAYNEGRRVAGKVWKAAKRYTTKNKETQTKKKSKGKKFSHVHSLPGGGETHSNCIVKYKKKKLSSKFYKIVGSASIYGFNQQVQIEVARGTQAVSLLHTGFKGSENSATLGGDIKALFNFARTVNAAVPTSLGANLVKDVSESYKLFLEKITVKIELHNMTPNTCHIDIYDVIAKQTYPSRIADGDPGTDGDEVFEPISDWAQGLRQLAMGTVVTAELPSTARVGTKPTESKVWNMRWRIVKVSSVTMEPSSSHIHTWFFKPNRLIDTAYFTANNIVKGLTHFTMAVTRGGLVDSDASPTFSGASASQGVGYGPAKVGGISQTRYVSRLIALTPNNRYIADVNLNTTSALMYAQHEDVQPQPQHDSVQWA